MGYLPSKVLRLHKKGINVLCVTLFVFLLFNWINKHGEKGTGHQHRSIKSQDDYADISDVDALLYDRHPGGKITRRYSLTYASTRTTHRMDWPIRKSIQIQNHIIIPVTPSDTEKDARKTFQKLSSAIQRENDVKPKVYYNIRSSKRPPMGKMGIRRNGPTVSVPPLLDSDQSQKDKQLKNEYDKVTPITGPIGSNKNIHGQIKNALYDNDEKTKTASGPPGSGNRQIYQQHAVNSAINNGFEGEPDSVPLGFNKESHNQVRNRLPVNDKRFESGTELHMYETNARRHKQIKNNVFHNIHRDKSLFASPGSSLARMNNNTHPKKRRGRMMNIKTSSSPSGNIPSGSAMSPVLEEGDTHGKVRPHLNVFGDSYMKPQNMPDSKMKHQGRYNSNDMKLQFVSGENLTSLYGTSGNKKSQTIIDTYRRKGPLTSGHIDLINNVSYYQKMRQRLITKRRCKIFPPSTATFVDSSNKQHIVNVTKFMTDNTYAVVNAFQYSITINGNSLLCDLDTDLVVMVISAPENAGRRKAIRQTWGAIAKDFPWPNKLIIYNIKVFFVMGHQINQTSNSRLVKENLYHEDIIVGKFIDSPKNDTLKSLLAMQWVTKNCESAMFYIKTEDNTFLNIPYVARLLQDMGPETSIISEFIKVTDEAAKTKLTQIKNKFNLHDLPPYLTSSTYIITTDIIKGLLTIANYVPILQKTDEYICGTLGTILGAKHMSLTGFSRWNECPPLECAVAQESILSGNMERKMLLAFWKALEEAICL